MRKHLYYPAFLTVVAGLAVLAVLAVLATGWSAPVEAQDVPCPHDPDHPNGVAVVESVFKDIWSYHPDHSKEMVRLTEGTVLCSYHTVHSGKRGRARIRFFDEDRGDTSGPSIVSIGSSTKILVQSFAKTYDPNPDAGTIDVIFGKIRSIMKTLLREPVFSVRTGTSLCGSRGTTYYVEVPKDRVGTRMTVEEGVVACRRVGAPGEELVEGGWAVEIGYDAISEAVAVGAEELAALADSVDAFDGWEPGNEETGDAAALTGLPLPGAGDLPQGCAAPVQAGASIPTSKYKYCDQQASAVYADCAVAHCITEARTQEMKRDRPTLVFEKLESSCRPACDEEAGFGWLDFAGHGGFCGKCEGGQRWHRGKGCCR
ncbi:MAG: FecR domain-containing protein [bacterium]|nr:FecR domain-containing protein [bacterium]